MEELEQPKQENSLGSNANFGKFKDAESLMKAYNNLEAKNKKKSQRLASLESENLAREKDANKRLEIEKKVDEFATKFEIIKPFSSALKESLIQDENSNFEEEVMKIITNNYKRAQDYASDDEFLNNYIYSNGEIKDKIIKDYLNKIPQNSPIRIDAGSNSIPLSPPNRPSTIQEAGRLAKSIIKQK